MAEAFWAFSLAFYDRPGVSAACIALQDEHMADVEVVLFALWCAGNGHILTDAELDAVDASIAGWRHGVVQPLRQARRALKTSAPPLDPIAADILRRQVIHAELEAERLQQAAMERQAPPPGTALPGQAARDNLARLARLTGIPPDAPAIATLLGAFG